MSLATVLPGIPGVDRRCSCGGLVQLSAYQQRDTGSVEIHGECHGSWLIRTVSRYDWYDGSAVDLLKYAADQIVSCLRDNYDRTFGESLRRVRVSSRVLPTETRRELYDAASSVDLFRKQNKEKLPLLPIETKRKLVLE